MALMVTVPVREQNARRFLGIAATLGVLGVAFNLNGGDDNTLPKVMAAVGVVALIWSIHRFGRLGPDEMIVFEEPEADPAPKKKKKKKRPPVADEASSNDGM
jgi:hypothetical protein